MALSIDLASVLATIRRRAIVLAEGGWLELGAIVNMALPDPLNPFALLPIATGVAAGGKLDNLIPAASAIVLVDVALRIVDDFADGDFAQPLFRGKGAGRALNAAMALNTIAVRELSHLNLPVARLDALQNQYYLSFLQVCQGQDQDMKESATTLEEYQTIVQNKTVAAYEFTALIGAVIASTEADVIARCSLCGHHLGWMTQIFNDISGLWFPESANAIEIEKRTFPVHLGLSLKHPNARVLQQMYREQNYDRSKICSLLDEMDIRMQLMHEALDHRDKAIEALAAPLNPEGQTILQHWLNWLLRDGQQILETG